MGIQPEGSINYADAAKGVQVPVVEEIVYTSNWAQQMSQVNLQKQLEIASATAARMVIQPNYMMR